MTDEEMETHNGGDRGRVRGLGGVNAVGRVGWGLGVGDKSLQSSRPRDPH